MQECDTAGSGSQDSHSITGPMAGHCGYLDVEACHGMEYVW